MVPNSATGVPVTGNQGVRSTILNPLKGPPFLFWGILRSLLTISEGPQISVDQIFFCRRSATAPGLSCGHRKQDCRCGGQVWWLLLGGGNYILLGIILTKSEFSWKLFQQFSFPLAIYRRLKLRLEVKLNKPSSIHRYFWQKHDANYNYKLSKIFTIFGSMDIFYENILSDSSPSAFLRHHLGNTIREGCME